MPEHRTDRADAESDDAPSTRFAVSALLLTLLAIATLAVGGVGVRFRVHGDFNVIYALLVLFFSINLKICYWEICLFFKRDYIERRAEYWLMRQNETGRKPSVEFLTGKVPLVRAFSPTVWADTWAAYSEVDASYADRRSYGYNVDIANGFLTPVPMLFLYIAYTFDFLPAAVAGIVGAMLFWQLTYATSVYWVSFFVANRQARISRRDMFIYIWALNCPWVLFALLGLYASIRLIVDGDYSVLGY